MSHAAGSPIWIGNDKRAFTLEPVSKNAGNLSAFDEAWLQQIVHDHPETLPIEQIEPGFGTPVSVCRELPLHAGFADNLLLTPEGNIILVEVKLWRNGEARREVVAQTLDYASCLFEMSYSDLEAAVSKSETWKDRASPRLHQLFEKADAPDPATFIDAVNTNLRAGRILILVVGDGIRTEMERLASLLQSHAGARFTFGLIQLAVYQLPDNLGQLVVPQTLLKTKLVERGVVLVDDKRTTVLPPPTFGRLQGGRTTITEEQFYEAMASLDKSVPDKLKAFVLKLQDRGVRTDFRASLNLMLDLSSGSSVNLGYIQRDGAIWTSTVNARKVVPEEIGHAYNEELAAALGVEVNKQHWSIWGRNRSLRILDIADRLDAWLPVIDRFAQRMEAELSK
jgi:hypothetical protein